MRLHVPVPYSCPRAANVGAARTDVAPRRSLPQLVFDYLHFPLITVGQGFRPVVGAHELGVINPHLGFTPLMCIRVLCTHAASIEVNKVLVEHKELLPVGWVVPELHKVYMRRTSPALASGRSVLILSLMTYGGTRAQLPLV